MWKQLVVFAGILYVLSTATSFGVFAYLVSKKPQPVVVVTETDEYVSDSALLDIDANEPRDQECPLNGKLFTQKERAAWEKRRPLAVMIENHPDARPQAGLASADIMFEMIAEGGVTRFMGIFYCGTQREDTILAPVRSARTYFMDYASGFNFPMYVHVGGANLPGPTDALGQIMEYGWALQNDINQFSVGYPTFVRNYNRIPGKSIATEHTMETTTEALWAVSEQRGWTNMSPALKVGKKTYPAQDWKAGYTGWQFADEKATGTAAPSISFEFWSGFSQYAVAWEFDEATSMYKRSMGGEPHTDMNTDKQIMAKNAVVLFTTEKGPINELKHMLYETTGTGDALIFTDGVVTKAKWSKLDREAELTFLDTKGKPLALGRGLTWISVVDIATKVQY